MKTTHEQITKNIKISNDENTLADKMEQMLLTKLQKKKFHGPVSNT